MSVNYASVIPENFKDSGYGEYDNVDFVLSFQNQSLNLGSIRLEGDLDITNNGVGLYDPTNHEKDIKFDNFVGAHTFIESVQTSMGQPIGGEVIENLTEYPRYVKMKTTASTSQTDMYNSSNVCELKAPNDSLLMALLEGGVPPVAVAGEDYRVLPDFSIKPHICLNSSSETLPHRRSGDIRVSINLNRTFGALFGLDVGATTKYLIKNLNLTYTTTEDDGSNEGIMLKTVLNIKQSILSSFSNTSSKVPAVCNSVSMSFNRQDRENVAHQNNTALFKVPNVTELQFLFNDSLNKGIAFVLRDTEETVLRYIDSFMDTGKNSLSPQKQSANDGYGIGLAFDDYIDLRTQKFNTQITSGLSSNTPLIMYMYFHSILKF
tara:strand:- start:5261 stop:6391 length:1131 start_codon:yes stop_codon:yes gene_type:complete